MSNGTESSREDDAIVSAALRDIDAFESLYHRYSLHIYRWIYRETRDQQTANDLTAQTFLQAMQNLHRYQPERSSSFRAWLFIIARNLLRDTWRRYRPTGEMPDLTDQAPGPEEIAVHRVMVDQLKEAMNHLPQRQLEIIHLRLAGLTIREIAEIQGTSENAVKAAQNRAFRTLREHLSEKVTL